jgi:hypothetical protein
MRNVYNIQTCQTESQPALKENFQKESNKFFKRLHVWCTLTRLATIEKKLKLIKQNSPAFQ